MTNTLNIKPIWYILKQHYKTFSYVSIGVAFLSFGFTFLLPKQYKSTSIIFPGRQFSVSKLVIEANAGNQEDYLMFGDADDCEKVLQLLNSDDLKLRLAKRFNLWTRWNIKDTTFALHYLKLEWNEMVSIKRTEFNSIKIEVYDRAPQSAADIANAIVSYCDSIRKDMNSKITSQVVRIVKEEYDLTLNRMKTLEDSLNTLRQRGVLHYKEQVKAYSKSYAKALEKGDESAARRLSAQLDTLKKYGSAYQNTKDNLDKYSAKYPDIKMKYDEALANNRTLIPIEFVAQTAYPNPYKARPVRAIWVLCCVISANVLLLTILLFKRQHASNSTV